MPTIITANKIDYTTIVDGKEEENHWIRKSVLFLTLLVCLGLYSTTNNNIRFVHNESVAATSSLVRIGAGAGAGAGAGVRGGSITTSVSVINDNTDIDVRATSRGQEDLSSTSVGDNSIESNTNLFVEEEGGLLENCDLGLCYHHNYSFEACNGEKGCYFYPLLNGGTCSSCSGVNCGGGHRAPRCLECPRHNYDCSKCPIYADGEWKGSGYCNGECNWQVDIDGVGSCGPKAHTYCDSTVTHPHHEYCPSGKKCPNCGSKRCVCPV